MSFSNLSIFLLIGVLILLKKLIDLLTNLITSINENNLVSEELRIFSRVTIQTLHVLNQTNILVVDLLLEDQVNTEDEE